ncbi:tRNA adenosine(34) deaminase TadA [Cycloclasticus pugetii]|uniref:tRNA adenosine(34) deaminase TadA n=1 Tax=Cycloclasticus pugetii TaxID=34068 RepID=UPI00093227D6|nr:tRNA adenosine(34) deaminase TadA [Cycloclasticus pugetii]
MLMNDEAWMRRAINLAHKAEEVGEVPVGAIIVKDNECISEGYNLPIKNNDPTAHAEIVAIRDAGLQLDNYRLVDTTLFVTLEPCVMCLGAIQHARIKRIVFGALDEKRGAVCSALSLTKASYANHHVEWTGGVLAKECSELLNAFFKKRRK